MYKTTLVPAVKKSIPEVREHNQDTKVIITRDDEIYDVGTEYLTLRENDTDNPFHVMEVSSLLGFTNAVWIFVGIDFANTEGNVIFWIKGSDFLAALQDLGFTQFDHLAEFL